MGSIDVRKRRAVVDALALAARAFEREADDAMLADVEAYAAAPLSGLPDKAQKFADRAKRSFEKALASREDAVDEALWKDYLDAAYAELFLGVSTDPIAPFESVYRSAEKTLYGKQHFAISDLMKEVGFEKPADFKEPNDHLAIELSLYVKLERDAFSALDAGDRDEATQLLAYARVLKEDHMDAWFGSACDDLIARDESNGLYAGMAYLAKAGLAALL